MLRTDVKLTEMFLAQLETEGPRTRRALADVPDGIEDWQPHEESLPVGRLASLLASAPFWVESIVEHDAIDLAPMDGRRLAPPTVPDGPERVHAFDEALERARLALERTTDEHLRRPWRLLEGGRVVSENPRCDVLRETFIQLATYRSQLLTHVRLHGARVPATEATSMAS